MIVKYEHDSCLCYYTLCYSASQMHYKTKQEFLFDIQGYAGSLEISKKTDGEGS